jgi:hypothetical protein
MKPEERFLLFSLRFEEDEEIGFSHVVEDGERY